MKLLIDLHIPPDEVRKKQCMNCLYCRASQYSIIKEDEHSMVDIIHTCEITLKTIYEGDDANLCHAYYAAHWETIRVNDYRRLL